MMITATQKSHLHICVVSIVSIGLLVAVHSPKHSSTIVVPSFSIEEWDIVADGFFVRPVQDPHMLLLYDLNAKEAVSLTSPQSQLLPY